MVDILFLAKGRKEFTEASWKVLLENTLIPHFLYVFVDGDATAFDWFDSEAFDSPPWQVFGGNLGGPVACLNAFLEKTSGEFIAKIDNDTIVPPGWLEACLDVMKRHPEVDLLGLEPWAPDSTLFPASCLPRKTEQMRPTSLHDCMDVEEWNGTRWQSKERGIRIVSHVGGIGLFRRSAFERFGKPTPNSTDGRYGFTEWQWQNPEMVKAFLDPPLPVFLLDHLPFQPWIGHSMRYEQMGVQRRQWGFYAEGHRALWDWWKP